MIFEKLKLFWKHYLFDRYREKIVKINKKLDNLINEIEKLELA